ncbi:hypothetical protein, partial [Xanthovirga aplysinae]|uniref:hypothetical protein n=1 Tax=Xanthovirga aplysinae TaxID=2529853 RepID=UPI001CA3E530
TLIRCMLDFSFSINYYQMIIKPKHVLGVVLLVCTFRLIPKNNHLIYHSFTHILTIGKLVGWWTLIFTKW